MGEPFPEQVAPGGVLVFPQIQSPNYVPGISGWSIMSNGDAQFNELSILIQSSSVGLLIYSGVAGPGNLIGSWATAAGVDAYGNTYPAGFYTNQGALYGITLAGSTITGSTIIGALINAGIISQPSITGGTISETAIQFDTTGGVLLCHATTTTTTTITTSGEFTSTITGPAKIECWGAGSGGGGGSSTQGGETGGGGEYACEPNYSLVSGQQYPVQIGQGGAGGVTGSDGNSGGQTSFNGQAVVANGGIAGSSSLAGAGGSGSVNTIHFNGGNGQNASGFSGAASGANSGNATAAGNNGIASTGSTGAAAPAAQSGSGTGGAGGGNLANGSSGTAPGGAGGGAGKGSASSGATTQTWYATNSYSYYGSTATYGGGANSLRDSGGTMYQGSASGYLNLTGDQFSFALFNYSAIASALSGATINTVKLQLTNLHSWYSGGCYVVLGYTTSTTFGSSFTPGGGSHENQTSFWINEGTTVTAQDITGAGIGTAFQSGGATALMFGPSSSTSGGSGDLYNYGYFYGYGVQTSEEPALIINYTPSGGGASESAGNGANGQIKVTYTSASTLICSVSPVAGTDPVTSTAYPAGFARLEGSQYTQLRGTQTSVTPITVTSTSSTNLSALWTIPANDAVVGTQYRLKGWGWGTWGSTQETLAVGPGFATRTRTETFPAATMPVSQGFEFDFEYTLTIITSTTAWQGSRFTISAVGASHVYTAGQMVISGGSNGSSTGEAITLSSANTMAYYVNWGGAFGTITCVAQTFERIGP